MDERAEVDFDVEEPVAYRVNLTAVIMEIKETSAVTYGSSSSSQNNDSDVEPDESETEPRRRPKCKLPPASKFDVGDYVVIKYEDDFFPGKAMILKKQGAEVNVLARSAINWKWPSKPDQMF